jgi:hypothetical protein
MLEIFRRARDAIESDPAEAAGMLREIADRLETAGFVPHAVLIREQQAESLGSAGERSTEALVRLRLGWRSLDAATFAAQAQVREVASGPMRQKSCEHEACSMRSRARPMLKCHSVATAFDALEVSIDAARR